MKAISPQRRRPGRFTRWLCIGAAAIVLACDQPTPPDDPHRMTATEAAAVVQAGETSVRDVVEASLAEAAAGHETNAFVALDADGAMAAATAADERLSAGQRRGPLEGVVVAVKDNILIAELPATGGTPALRDFVPDITATAVERLNDAGAIVLGKTNLHELGLGITSENSSFGAVANAYDASRFAGGSSGGSAVAVAKDMVHVGLGTDTGGSIAIPAALNGVVGFRPSTGRYPADGMIPISRSRDTVGPMARSVADIALLDAVLAGQPPAPLNPASLEDARLGIASPFSAELEEETEKVFEAALAELEAAGVELVPVDATSIVEINGRPQTPITLYEMQRDLPAFLEKHAAGVSIEGLVDRIASPEVRHAFETASRHRGPPAEEAYREALTTHWPALREAYRDLITRHELDALIFPATPLPAAPLGSATVELAGEELATFHAYVRNIDAGSTAGVPGLVLPMGLTAEGLPVGLAVAGIHGTDRSLLALGLAIEDTLGRIPPPPSMREQ